MQATGFQE